MLGIGGGGSSNDAAALAAAVYDDFASYDDEDVDASQQHQVVADDIDGGKKQGRKRGHQKKQKRSAPRKTRKSSSDDDSGNDSDDNAQSNESEYDSSSDDVKKKKQLSKQSRKKKPAAMASRRPARRSQSSEPFTQLVSAALKSHKKQEQNKLIDELKSDVMGILQARLLGGEAAAKKESVSSTAAAAATSQQQHGTMKRDYIKRIRSAYRDMKHNSNDSGVTIGGKFGSDEHKANISSLFTKLDQVHDVELKRIPHIDQALDIDNVMGDSTANRMKITTLGKKHIQSSPDKVISEAEYNSLTDAYGACILYRYFFSFFKPYLDIPYVS